MKLVERDVPPRTAWALEEAGIAPLLARLLAGQGRRVICPDIFGRGISDWLVEGALYSVPTYVTGLAPMLASLERPYDWVGTSMGGLITMALAAVKPKAIVAAILNDVGPEVAPEEPIDGFWMGLAKRSIVAA